MCAIFWGDKEGIKQCEYLVQIAHHRYISPEQFFWNPEQENRPHDQKNLGPDGGWLHSIYLAEHGARSGKKLSLIA